MEHFPRTSAFHPDHPTQQRGRVEDEAPGPSPLRTGSFKRMGVTEVPTHELENLLEDLRRIASYTNVPQSVREEIDTLADTVYSTLR